jgi:hypothetical protein
VTTRSWRIGLGTTVLARGLVSNGHLDGIGIYSRELLNTLGRTEVGVEVSPVVFGNERLPLVGHAKCDFPLNFEISSGLSYLTRMSTPGARSLHSTAAWHSSCRQHHGCHPTNAA